MEAVIFVGPVRKRVKALRMILIASYQDPHAQRSGFMEEEHVEILVEQFADGEVTGRDEQGTPVRIALIGG